MSAADVKIFPQPLEWLGGRNSIHQNVFSARNAIICLNDMLDGGSSEPVTLEISGEKFTIRPHSSTPREFDLHAVKNIHIFPNHSEYAVLEICPEKAQSRLEVVRGLDEHAIESVRAFLSGVEIQMPKPSAPKYPESPSPVPAREESHTFIDSYTENECKRASPTENGIGTPEYQNEDGYEEVAQQLINATLQESIDTRASMPDVALEQEHEIKLHQEELVERMPPRKDEEEEEEEPSLVTSSSSSVSDSVAENAQAVRRQSRDQSPEIPSKSPELSSEEQMSEKEMVVQIQPREEVPTNNYKTMAKPVLLVDLVDMDRYCAKHTKDDGRLYVMTKKTDDRARIKPLHTDISVYEKRHMPKKYVSHLYM